METYERPGVEKLIRRILYDRMPLIVAVTGPRQTGKTTMIRQALRRIDIPSRYVPVEEIAEAGSASTDAGEPEGRASAPDVAWLRSEWRAARIEAERDPRGFVLALDEVQAVSGWSTAVKGLWDADRAAGRPLRVVVAGSAPWSVLTGVHDSLVGRFMPVDVTHWSFPEMSAAFGFDIKQYLAFGGYPGPARAVDDPSGWSDYVTRSILRPHLERDLAGLSRPAKPTLMSRLLQTAIRYSGQIVSYNKILGQLQDAGNTTTIADYLLLLERAGLVAALGLHSDSLFASFASSPKLNVLNTALMTCQRLRSPDELRADRTHWGRVVESAVGAHLFNTLETGHTLGYWRRGNHELDFVLAGPAPGEPVAIEVKSGSGRIRPETRAAFLQQFPRGRVELVGERGVPLEEFLSKPASHWADPAGRADRVRETAPVYSPKPGPSPWTTPAFPDWREHEDRRPAREQAAFMRSARAEADELARGAGAVDLWRRIARAYLGVAVEYLNEEPLTALRRQLEGDEELFEAVLAGLPLAASRDDLAGLAEIVRGEDDAGGDAVVILASVNERERAGRDPVAELDEAELARAVGCYHLVVRAKRPPWHVRACAERPAVCAEALAAVHRDFARRGIERLPDLWALVRGDSLAKVAHAAVPKLLGAFPTRCKRAQVSMLGVILWAGLLHGPRAELRERVRRRIAARGMDPAQRTLWLAAGLCTAHDEHGTEAVRFLLSGREERTRRLLGFLLPDWTRRRDLPEPWEEWDVELIAEIFPAFARWFDPCPVMPRSRYEQTTLGLSADWLMRRLLELLAERGRADVLMELEEHPALDEWRDVITAARGGMHSSAPTLSCYGLN